MAGRAVSRPRVDRRTVVAVAIVAGAAALAWLAAGVVSGRAIAARLPVLDVTAVTPPVRAALEAADAAARTRPSASTAGALGRAYHGAQRPASALAAYAVAERLDPSATDWLYLQAVLLDERGDPEALARLQRVVDRDPSFGLAWLRLGELAARQGRADEARAAYDRAAAAPTRDAYRPEGVASRQTWPVSAYAGAGLARLDLAAGRDADAAARLQRLLETYPSFTPARALARIAAGRDAAAPTRLSPSSGGSYVPPADPLVDAIVAESADSDVLLKYAGLATRAGDAAWREYLVRRAARLHPDNPYVLLELSAMLQARGALDDALAALRRHETLAPDDHHGLVQQGRVLADLGRLAEAETVLRRAVAVRDAAAEYNLGTVLDGQARANEARTHYERALAIDPFHARAMHNLGIGLDRAGDPAAALAWFERAVAIDPDAAEFHVSAGLALIHLRRFDDAIDTLTAATTLNPRSADGFNNLGIALASSGDLERARQALQTAVTIAPRHASARDNLARVSAALGK